MKQINDDDTIIRRVQKGMQLLDEHEPGWISQINLETLDMAYHGLCLLSQLCGSFADGIEQLGLGSLFDEDAEDSDGWEYGFTLPPWASAAMLSADYARLTQEWRKQIALRTSVAPEFTPRQAIERGRVFMDTTKMQQLASDPTHIRHIALDLASCWLANNAGRIAEDELIHWDEGDGETIMATGAPFLDPIMAAIRQIAEDLQRQGEEAARSCMHQKMSSPATETTIRAMLAHMPAHYAPVRFEHTSDGYVLQIEHTIIFQRVSAQEALKRTRDYIAERERNGWDLPIGVIYGTYD